MSAITHRIEIADAHAHLFRVTLTLADPQAHQRVSLPVWIPGSYLVREFARHWSALRAEQGGRPIAVTAVGKAEWQLDCVAGTPLTLTALVYAFDSSVRSAFLDARRGFFNGTSVCLRVAGRDAEPQRLELRGLPDGWHAATTMPALEVDERGHGVYQAADYDELVDHPFELGAFWRGRFDAAGVPHDIVVSGALPDFDGARLLVDAQRICETTIMLWHGDGPPPFARYLFLLNTVEDGGGGLEHRASTALLAARRDLPRRGEGLGNEASDGYVGLLGLIAHEYFHAWNVKRLRPAELARIDYTAENHTRLLWFFEGFTSYYDELLLRRAGRIDDTRYLKLLAKTVGGVLGAPGRAVQSVAQASFDAWTKYYRPDEHSPNATVSYYAKGALVALAFDLTLRREGKGTLDEVLRMLWRRSGGGPITEADIADALAAVAGRRMDAELAAWVHGTGELPLRELLAAVGVDWNAATPTLAQRLGLRVSESALTGVKISHVLRGGAGERAGLAAGDELLAIAGWRLRRLDDALRLLQPDAPASALVARDARVLDLPLTLPATGQGTVALLPQAGAAPAVSALRGAWLGG